MEVLRVEDAFDSMRLDVVLASHEKVSSRSEAQRIIKSGSVTINNTSEQVSSKRKVKVGDIIEFLILPEPPSDLIPVSKDLDIIYEDDHLLVVNKPRGMVVHPSAGHHSDTLVNYLLHHTTLADSDTVRPGIVHRIDKDTSGLLVVTKSIKVHEHLADQFFHHTIERKYEAIVWGIPGQPSGKIDNPIGRHPSNRKKFAVRHNGKSAVTHWKTLQTFRYLSLVECRLETGRTHQIRVHLSSIGHPLLGDSLYGRFRNYTKKLPDKTINLLKSFDGQALHAKSLGFLHPETGNWVRFEAETPKEICLVLEALEKIE